MRFVLQVVVNAVAIWLADLILSGMEVVGAATTWHRVGIFLLVALVFSVVNAIVKPLLHVLALPLYILTLGLFLLVTNALMLMLTAWITEQTSWGLRLDSFGTAVVAGLIVAVISMVLGGAVRSNRH